MTHEANDQAGSACRLTPYERIFAPVLLTWVRSDEELFWLAPQTQPPLTVEKIDDWTARRDDPFLFWRDADVRTPIGYGELNRMPNDDHHLWLGHLIIAPSMRRRGWGIRMMHHFLQVGFQDRRTQEISLVVFPENVGAIRCYRRAGLAAWGEQRKTFGTAGNHYRMTHMGIRRAEFESIQASVKAPPAQ